MAKNKENNITVRKIRRKMCDKDCFGNGTKCFFFTRLRWMGIPMTKHTHTHTFGNRKLIKGTKKKFCLSKYLRTGGRGGCKKGVICVCINFIVVILNWKLLSVKLGVVLNKKKTLKMTILFCVYGGNKPSMWRIFFFFIVFFFAL